MTLVCHDHALLIIKASISCLSGGRAGIIHICFVEPMELLGKILKKSQYFAILKLTYEVCNDNMLYK